jgi:hypothetical protein
LSFYQMPVFDFFCTRNFTFPQGVPLGGIG